MLSPMNTSGLIPKPPQLMIHLVLLRLVNIHSIYKYLPGRLF
jgi:hypothetical protein